MGKQIINGLCEVGGAMFNKVLLTSFLTVFAVINVANATGGNVTVTSKDYVDNVAGTKQVKIPSAGQSGVGIGDTVMTYTSGGNGAIGERGIFSGASNYNAEADADKLITAGALNGAISSIPRTETSKLTCYDNDCTLWSIGTQTAYGGLNWLDLVRRLQAELYLGPDDNSYCSVDGNSVPLYERDEWGVGLESGEWKTEYDCAYDEQFEPLLMKGVSSCSSVYNGEETYEVAVDQSGVQADYLDGAASAPTDNPAGGYCYCKMTAPYPLVSRWVFFDDFGGSLGCASSCASACSGGGAEFVIAVVGLQ